MQRRALALAPAPLGGTCRGCVAAHRGLTERPEARRAAGHGTASQRKPQAVPAGIRIDSQGRRFDRVSPALEEPTAASSGAACARRTAFPG